MNLIASRGGLQTDLEHARDGRSDEHARDCRRGGKNPCDVVLRADEWEIVVLQYQDGCFFICSFPVTKGDSPLEHGVHAFRCAGRSYSLHGRSLEFAAESEAETKFAHWYD